MKELRKRAGLTRAQLAEETGINFRTLEAYEQGRKDINGAKLKTLLKLCQALDCELEELITDSETKELLKFRDERENYKKRKMYSYYAILSKEAEESEISVLFPDLNCATSGTDRDEALKSAKELLQCTLKGLTEDGEKIPKASELSEIVKNEKEEVVLIETTIIE